MKKESNLCECGCGDYAEPGKKYIHGHNRRKPKTEPTLCECGCGDYAKPGNRYINGHNRKGIKHSDTTREKMSEERRKYYEDPIKREKTSDALKKYYSDPKTHEKASEVQKKRFEDPILHEKMLDVAIKRWEDPLEHEKASEMLLKRYEDPEERILQSCRALNISREEWDGFGSVYCELWCEELREYIRDKYNRICYICGKTEEENGRKLDVHHVDYNKDCGCDDTECILVPLCKKCHGKTTFGDREMWEDIIIKMLEDSKL